MIIDQLALFSDKQDITSGSASGVLATGSIDLGVAGLNVGTGKTMYVVVTVTTAFTGTNANATKIDVITDSDGAMATTPIVLQTLEKIPTNSLAGTKVVGKLEPFAATANKRYLGLKYTADNTLTTGIVSAVLVEGAALEATYAQSSGAAIANS